MMSEAADVAESLGLRIRVSIDQRIDGASKVGDHKTSMLQDVIAGRSLELDALVGAFVELGQLAGVALPATEALLAVLSLRECLRDQRSAEE
jgi:2-dehydropantoate 2-reductase